MVTHVLHEGSNQILAFNFQGPVARPTDTELTSLCQTFWSNFGSTIAGFMTTGYQFILVDATDRYAEDGQYGSYVPTTSSQGTKGADSAPANVAAVISWKTGYASRKRRGRTYMQGWADSDFTGSTLTSANVIALSNFAQALIIWPGAVVCPADFSIASIAGDFLTPVIGFGIDNAADSQRRRLPGRGF